MRVWLCQCLCPQRHALLALAGEFADAVEAEVWLMNRLGATVADMLEQRVMNPWCGICGAKANSWRYEVGPTRWRSMQEAGPELVKQQAGNIVAKAMFGSDGPPPTKQ